MVIKCALTLLYVVVVVVVLLLLVVVVVGIVVVWYLPFLEINAMSLINVKSPVNVGGCLSYVPMGVFIRNFMVVVIHVYEHVNNCFCEKLSPYSF